MPEYERLLYCEGAYGMISRLWTEKHFAHALLIEGAAGSGKRTLAKYAAARILCRGQGERPCFKCPACRKIAAGSHPDLIWTDGNEEKIYSIDKLRDMRTDAFIAPNESEHKVYVLTEAQNIPPQNQNALLKILEEPPEHVCFILTSTSRGALLPTILSRLTVLPMPELTPNEREQVLGQICPKVDTAQRSQAAIAFETVGQAKDALSDKHTQGLLASISALCDAIAARDRYTILRELSAYDGTGKRDDYIEMLSLLRTACIRRMLSENPPFSALQCRRIVDIIEKTQTRAAVNVGRVLLSTVLADGLIAAV